EGMPALTVSAGVIPDSRIVDTFLDVSQYQDGIAKPGIRVVETQSVGGPWMDEADSVVLGLVQADLADVFPQFKGARILKQVVVRLRGLFSAWPPGERHNGLHTHTSVGNLFLAGDWVCALVRSIFMENAVITGRAAASAVLELEGKGSVPML